MNADMKHELESALKSDMSLMQVVALLQKIKERGASQGEVYAWGAAIGQVFYAQKAAA